MKVGDMVRIEVEGKIKAVSNSRDMVMVSLHGGEKHWVAKNSCMIVEQKFEPGDLVEWDSVVPGVVFTGIFNRYTVGGLDALVDVGAIFPVAIRRDQLRRSVQDE